MIWKTHPRYRNYEVSNEGYVRGKAKKIILKPRYNKGNKPSVTIHDKNGGILQKLVGQLVLETFRNKNRNGHNAFINLDGDFNNNHIDNLVWTRFKYQNEMPVIQIDSTGTIVNRWGSVAQACLENGFTQSSIISCCNGRSETHKGFYWIFGNSKVKNLTIRTIEIKATSDNEELIFNTMLDAYYHFIKLEVTYATYESFYNSVTIVKNNSRKNYLGYKWKIKNKYKKIKIYD